MSTFAIAFVVGFAVSGIAALLIGQLCAFNDRSREDTP